MRFIDTYPRITEQLCGQPFDLERWLSYAAEISPELPDKLWRDVERYDLERDVLPVVRAALENRRELERAHQSFVQVAGELDGRWSQVFGGELDADVVFYLGLCHGAGWATELDGKRAVLLGVEKIVELNWGGLKELRALVYHELGHIWHDQAGAAAFPQELAAVEQLYQEGVAMYCEQLICGDFSYYHQDGDGWLDWCLEREQALKREYGRRVAAGESVQDFFGDWCSYQGRSDIGYFLGCQWVKFLRRRLSLEEIARMKPEEAARGLDRYVQAPVE